MAVEGRRWIELALDKSTNSDLKLRAGVLRSSGHLIAYFNELQRSRQLLNQALVLYRDMQDDCNAAWTMAYLGMAHEDGNPQRIEKGIALCKEAITQFRFLDEKPGLAYTFNLLGELARSQNDYDAAQRYYEESLLLVKETGEHQREAMLLNNLSFVAYRQGDYRQSLELAQQSLIDALELKSEFRQACFIATLAGPAAALGQPERAARLLGASYARFEALGTRHAPVDQKEIEQFEGAIRRQLGEKAFEKAWQAGQEMALQVAVSLALEEMDSEV
jgi:tetratricopeptide (TPR) repeat protein